jgi:hypothetical protein
VSPCPSQRSSLSDSRRGGPRRPVREGPRRRARQVAMRLGVLDRRLAAESGLLDAHLLAECDMFIGQVAPTATQRQRGEGGGERWELLGQSGTGSTSRRGEPGEAVQAFKVYTLGMRHGSRRRHPVVAQNGTETYWVTSTLRSRDMGHGHAVVTGHVPRSRCGHATCVTAAVRSSPVTPAAVRRDAATALGDGQHGRGARRAPPSTAGLLGICNGLTTSVCSRLAACVFDSASLMVPALVRVRAWAALGGVL